MNDSVERCSYRMISIRQREIHVRTVLIALPFFASIRPYRFHSLWMGTIPLIRPNCSGPLVFFPLANFSTKRFCLQSVCILLLLSASQSSFIIPVIIPISPSQFWLSIDLHNSTVFSYSNRSHPLVWWARLIVIFVSSCQNVCMCISCIFYFLVT